jgi:hypothetical protein
MFVRDVVASSKTSRVYHICYRKNLCCMTSGL